MSNIIFYAYDTRAYHARICRADRRMVSISAESGDMARVALWLKWACASHLRALSAKPAARRTLP